MKTGTEKKNLGHNGLKYFLNDCIFLFLCFLYWKLICKWVWTLFTSFHKKNENIKILRAVWDFPTKQCSVATPAQVWLCFLAGNTKRLPQFDVFNFPMEIVETHATAFFTHLFFFSRKNNNSLCLVELWVSRLLVS